MAADTRKSKRDYSAELLARIDQHLEGLPKGRHVEFLQSQIDKWTGNFQRWQVLVDAGESTARFGDAVATDFSLTIAGIGARLAAAREREAA